MLKFFLVGLGVAFVAGGAYVVSKMKQNNLKKNESGSNQVKKPQYENHTSHKTPLKNGDESAVPAKNETRTEDIRELEEKCWELYKKTAFLEKATESYKEAFSGNKILYYTQRILGELFVSEAASIKRIVGSIEKIEDMLSILSYDIETAKTDVPYTKEAFFANRIGNITCENLRNKIAELEMNANKLEKSKNYIFYTNLYNTTVSIYEELIELVNSEETMVKKFDLIAKKLVDALNRIGIKVVYATEIDESQKDSMFNSNPGASSIPAVVDETNGRVILKGNFQ